MRAVIKEILIIIVLFGVAFVLWSVPKQIGDAYVIDGDTIVLNSKKIRLAGIDAPELQQMCGLQQCGMAAKAYLQSLVKNHQVSCKLYGRDKYGRYIGLCFAGGHDLAAQLVSQGHAVAYRRYSARYAGLEDIASEAKLGIWGERFERPEQWRISNVK